MKGFIVSVNSKSEPNRADGLLYKIIAGEEENAIKY
jgi:hypothetical protein